MKYIAWQLAEALVLLCVATFGVYFPYRLKSTHPNYAVFLAFGNSFSGGVVLSAGIVHMLSDASMILLSEVGSANGIITANCCCVVGVLVPFFLEKGGLIFWMLKHDWCRKLRVTEQPTKQRAVVEQSLGKEVMSESPTKALLGIPNKLDNMVRYSSVPDREKNYGTADIERKRSSSHGRICRRYSDSDKFVDDEHPSRCIVPSIGSLRLQNKINNLRYSGFSSVVDHADMMYGQNVQDSVEHCGHDLSPQKHTHAAFATVVLAIILSIHSIFAGVTLGIAGDDSKYSLDAFIALVTHKFFEAFALGIAACHAERTRAQIIQTTMYIISTPLGIAIGAVVAEWAFDRYWEGIVVAVTAGSFIYIALVEIISEEFDGEEYRVAKFLCFVFGAITMAAVGFWVG